MLLLLLGCADSWIERPYACEFDVLDWWEDDVAWLVARAEEGEDGVWQFDAPSSYAGIERSEGYWDPDAERLGYTDHWTEASSHVRVDIDATGRVERNGDLDLVLENYSYDELGFLGAWTDVITREGCDMERTAVVHGREDSGDGNAYTYTIVDDDTVEGVHVFTDGETGGEWVLTSTVTHDLVRAWHGAWDDDHFVEDGVKRPSGETELVWEDRSYVSSGWVIYGEDRIELDGTLHRATRSVLEGEVQQTCEAEESYAGVGVNTCYEPPTGVTCVYTWDPDQCTGTCDDGSTSAC